MHSVVLRRRGTARGVRLISCDSLSTYLTSLPPAVGHGGCRESGQHLDPEADSPLDSGVRTARRGALIPKDTTCTHEKRG